MTIAFDIYAENGLSASFFGMQLKKFLVKLAHDSPGHSFIIYDNKTWAAKLPGNLSVHHKSNPATAHWFRRLFSKPSLQPDIWIKLFHPQVRINRGTCLLVSDLSPLIHPEQFSIRQTLRFKKKLVKAIATAKTLIVCSNVYRHFLITQLHVPDTQIQLWTLEMPLTITGPGWDQKEQVKERFTDGKEYFLFAGDLHPRHGLITLLKAFSDFKKWQRSGMNLMLAGYVSDWSPELDTLLATYKYRQDVVLIKDPADTTLESIISAAYCVVYPALYDPFPQLIKYAMALKVPVITSDIPEIRQEMGDHIIYVESTATALSRSMQRIFKDESWRTEIIEKAFVEPGVKTAAELLNLLDPQLLNGD